MAFTRLGEAIAPPFLPVFCVACSSWRVSTFSREKWQLGATAAGTPQCRHQLAVATPPPRMHASYSMHLRVKQDRKTRPPPGLGPCAGKPAGLAAFL